VTLIAVRNFACAAICAEFTRCVYTAVVEGFACRRMLWMTGRFTSFAAKNVASE
jgi:hypothetical protein